MRAEGPTGAVEVPARVFLQRARRRYLTRELLGAAGASAAASILLGLSVGWLNRVFTLELPGISIGILLLVISGAASLRRNRVPRVAARVDRSLRLQDRLVTFLDFSNRGDVGRAFREAQAREAAATLARTDLTRGIPVPRLLWAAPLLFGWMLYLDYFRFFEPFANLFLQQEVRVVDPQRVANRTMNAAQDKAAGQKPGKSATPAAQEDHPATAPPGAAPTAEQAPKPPEEKDPAEGKNPPQDKGAPGGGDPGSPQRLASVPAIIGEPARLYSEPVGKGLTPVAKDPPGHSPAAPSELPEPVLRGRISFNLVPVDSGAVGPAGEGTKPGAGKAEGLGITIDYDALPPEYRPQVWRYFNALIRLFQGGTDGT